MNRKKKGNQYILEKDYAIIIVISKKWGKKEIFIDLSDIEKCKKYTWGISFAPSNHSFYASTHFIHPKRLLSLSRYIADCPKEKIVDHINHNTLDNRKFNLRICDYLVNGANRIGASKNNILKIRNVRYVSKLKKYIVRVKQYHIGVYDSLEDAKEAAITARKEILTI